MRKQLTSAAALAALLMAGPAIGAQQGMGQQSQSQYGGQQMQGQPGQQGQMHRQQAAEQNVPLKMSGESIRTIQQTLQEQGFYKGQVDGQWGPGTQQALRQFQQQKGIQSQGQMDFQTMAALDLDLQQLAQSEQQAQQAMQPRQGSPSEMSGQRPPQ